MNFMEIPVHESCGIDEQLVTELMLARDGVRLVRKPSHFGSGLTLEYAYKIGRGLHERLSDRGFQPIGRKIGFTNRILWEQFQVSEPVWAYMYRQTVHFVRENHQRLSLTRMVAPRLEPEIVLKLRSVPSGEHSVEELAMCIEWAAIGFEIVDTHFADWRFTAAEAVADFGLHGALVVGTSWRVDAEVPRHVATALQSVKVSLKGSHEFIADGEGGNALGSPLLALGFLARVLSGQAWTSPLMPGDVIATGTLTAVPYVRGGESYRVEVAGAPLAPLQLDFSESTND
jgi:2-oxo-3-hexenedioate decarboxylase